MTDKLAHPDGAYASQFVRLKEALNLALVAENKKGQNSCMSSQDREKLNQLLQDVVNDIQAVRGLIIIKDTYASVDQNALIEAAAQESHKPREDIERLLERLGIQAPSELNLFELISTRPIFNEQAVQMEAFRARYFNDTIEAIRVRGGERSRFLQQFLQESDTAPQQQPGRLAP